MLKKISIEEGKLNLELINGSLLLSEFQTKKLHQFLDAHNKYEILKENLKQEFIATQDMINAQLMANKLEMESNYYKQQLEESEKEIERIKNDICRI